jgi:hypothetical protein
MAAVLTWAPLYKAPFPLGPAYLEHMFPFCLGSFRGGGACPLRLVEAERGWRHAGLRPLSILSGLRCF